MDTDRIIQDIIQDNESIFQDNEDEPKTYSCKFCNRSYLHQSSVSRHKKTCKFNLTVKDKELISSLKDQVIYLVEQLKVKEVNS